MRQEQKSNRKNVAQPNAGKSDSLNLAVIYSRVSTKNQVDNYSLESQEKACREYCARNGWVVDKVFIEEGESAKTVNRTQFQRMLSHCRDKKGQVKWVVVYNLTRFSRNSHDHLATRVMLNKYGVKLRSVTETIDETSQGKFMESIMTAVGQLDNDVKGDRTIVGMKAAVAAGRWVSKAPLGYRNSGDKTGASLICDPERGPLVRQAFELFATGLHTAQGVLEIVTAAGLRTRSGKPVPKQSFNQLLIKPVYAGWVEVSGWCEKQRGDFEPLVSQEIFDRVQAILSGKRASVMPRLRNHPDFPLRHFVRCGHCGRPLTASWSKGRREKYANYRCQNKDCKSVSITKAKLEDSFIEFLRGLEPQRRYLKLFTEIVRDVWKEKQAQGQDLNANLKKQVQKLKARKEQLVEAFVYDKAIDRPTYEQQNEALNNQIALAELEERNAKLDTYDVEEVLNFAEHTVTSNSVSDSGASQAKICLHRSRRSMCFQPV
jgi:DNA invertase Pin-like site-specific DNA recombinase